MLTETLLSNGAALFGMACLVVWPFASSRTAMLRLQLGLAIAFATHFALTGIQTAAVVNVIGAIQILVMLRYQGAVARAAGYGLAAAIVAASLATWDGPLSLVAAFGMGLIAVGRVQDDPTAMRLFILAGVPFWLAHDVIVESPIVAADILSLVTGSLALVRDNGPVRAPRGAAFGAR